MDEIKFKVRLNAPHFTQAPPEEVEKWAKNIVASADKAYKHSKKVIKTRKDYDQKISKPTEQAIDSFISPTYRTKHGLTKENIMNKTRDRRKRAAKRYFLKREQTYKTPKYEERVEFGKEQYAESWVKYRGPLYGHKKSGIKGLGSLGAMTLTNPPELKKWLKREDKIERYIDWKITKDEPVGKLANNLRNFIIRLGRLIIDTDYGPETIQYANEELNQRAEKYRLPKFAPFRPNGASHIDFIVVKIPDPAKPGETKKWLGIEIQVSTV